MKNLLNCSRLYRSFCKSVTPEIEGCRKVVQNMGNEVIVDFSLLDDSKASIDSIMVLNNQLNRDFFSKCMPLTQNVILADGGANHFFETQFRDSDKLKSIVGDFDCIKEDVMDYYQQKGVPIQYMSTLEDNDFCKALEKCLVEGWKTVFCFGAFGGRMDQTLSGMHYSQKYSKMYPELQIVLLGQSNMMFHLQKNIRYRIRISQDNISRFGCGIITFGKADFVETTGFKWNMGREFKYCQMQWGSFISTSNEMIQDQCTICSSCDLFFVANYSRRMRIIKKTE